MDTANTNPYHDDDTSIAARRTRPTRWMIWTGTVALSLAVLCLIATVFGMMWTFDTIASSSSTPRPSDLANGISNALFPSVAAAPLGIVGIVLLICGFVRRRPVGDT